MCEEFVLASSVVRMRSQILDPGLHVSPVY